MRILLVLSISVLLPLAAIAQTTQVQPTVIQRQTADGQALEYRYQTVSGTQVGALAWGGHRAIGDRYFGFVNNSADYLGFFSSTPIVFRVPLGSGDMIRIASTGVTVGANAADTAVRLTVNGAIDVKGNIAAKYQDLAEWVPAIGNLEPGTVVALAQETANTVTASSTPYDTRVAGVVSAEPGVILGEAGPSKVMVATTGRVKVKVDATAAPIKIGDLLVTSDKPGVAMKSQPVEIGGISLHRPGTVVGKALEPLATGTGEILVLLSMQ